jgi:hypothetical protein
MQNESQFPDSFIVYSPQYGASGTKIMILGSSILSYAIMDGPPGRAAGDQGVSVLVRVMRNVI